MKQLEVYRKKWAKSRIPITLTTPLSFPDDYHFASMWYNYFHCWDNIEMLSLTIVCSLHWGSLLYMIFIDLNKCIIMCVHHYRFIEGVQVLCHFSSSAYAIKLNKEKNHCVCWDQEEPVHCQVTSNGHSTVCCFCSGEWSLIWKECFFSSFFCARDERYLVYIREQI